MSDVTIAELRAGLRTSVEKIVNASGIVKFERDGLQIAIGGKQAQTVFKRGLGTVKATVMYPAMPQDARIKRGEADRLTGYSLHEIGHILDSDISVFSQAQQEGKLTRELMNGIEDARVERDLIRMGGAGGARSCLSTLATSSLQKSFENGYDPNKVSDLPVTLSMLGRAQLGIDVRGVEEIWEKMTPANRKFIEGVLPRLSKLSSGIGGTLEALECARQILKELPPPPQPPQQQQQEGEQQQGDGKQGGGKSKGKPQEQPQEQPQGGGESDGDGEGESEPQSDTQQGGGYSPGSNEDFQPQDAKDASLDVRSADVSDDIEDLAKKIRAREGGGDEQFGWTRSQFLDRGESSRDDEYNYLRNQVPPMGRVKNQLSQIIVAPEEAGWFGTQASGRFDRRRITDLSVGSENVFRRRWEKDGHESAVTLLVDGSGSMCGHNIHSAMSVVVSFSETLESMGVSFEACIFQDHWEDDKLADYSDTQGKELPEVRTTFEGAKRNSGAGSVRLLVIKPRNATLRRYRGTIADGTSCASGGTPDYAAIIACADRMLPLPERRKVLFVITDGNGAGAARILKLVKTYKNLGVDIIGVGIGQDVSEQYELSLTVSQLSDLAGSSMKLLLKQFDKYKDTVVVR